LYLVSDCFPQELGASLDQMRPASRISTSLPALQQGVRLEALPKCSDAATVGLAALAVRLFERWRWQYADCRKYGFAVH
jgi:hypothetical protein